MKWMSAVLLFASACSQASEINLISAAPCNKATIEHAKANGFAGINCDLLDSLEMLQDALVTASEDRAYLGEATSTAVDFVSRLIVVDCADDESEFQAVSVSNGVTIYADIFRRHASGLRVGVVTTASQSREPIQCGTYKPVGFVKFKTVSGFDTHVMVIKPYAFPRAPDEKGKTE
jgi:hypothetical protein